MGVRIYAYAVDLPQLNALLESSLADLLTRLSSHANDSHERFLTARQLQTLPTLRRSARDHLSSGSIYQSLWFLQAFSNCAGVNCIHRLIDGHRRWWIGSVLQFANGMIPAKDYDELTRLFQQMLRGLNCGHQMPDADLGFIADGLPFAPESDPDFRIGRWSERECSTAVRILSYIITLSPTFVRPPRPIGIAPDDAEWNQWVYSNIASLLRIADLDYSVCNLLTFIG